MACRERRDSQNPSYKRERAPVQKNKERGSAITEDNTVKTTGDDETFIGEVIMPRTSNQILREQRQRQIGQNITRFGVWDQGSKKLETSLVPSEQAVTLREISAFLH